MENMISEAASKKLVDLFYASSVLESPATKAYSTLLTKEDLDMASKKKVAPKRIRAKVASAPLESASLESEIAKAFNADMVERKRAKSPFDFSFHYNTDGGHVHLSFHGME